MLYKLEIENFYSVREKQILDLTISSSIDDPDDRFAPIFVGSDDHAPKVVALYGANASGKTTVLKALSFLTGFVRVGSQSMPLAAVQPFADAESAGQPIRFAMEMGGFTDFKDALGRTPSWMRANHNGLLRYELEIRTGDAGLVVAYESLDQKPQGKGRWQRIFERHGDFTVSGSDHFPTREFRHLQKTLGPGQSVLSSYGQFNHPTAAYYATAIGSTFTNIGIDPLDTDKPLADMFEAVPDILTRLNRDLNRIDAGIEAVRVDSQFGEKRLVFTHAGLGNELLWQNESRGTRAFVGLFPILTGPLSFGKLALVDEFDTLIHPLLLPEILRWFYDEHDRNPEIGQLWMTCHSPTLLEDLVKEEVVITEKDGKGRTRVFSLMDIKLRRDENLYKKYLGGSLGGIPVIG